MALISDQESKRSLDKVEVIFMPKTAGLRQTLDGCSDLLVELRRQADFSAQRKIKGTILNFKNANQNQIRIMERKKEVLIRKSKTEIKNKVRTRNEKQKRSFLKQNNCKKKHSNSKSNSNSEVS